MLSLAAIALFWKQKFDFPGVLVRVLYAVLRRDISLDCFGCEFECCRVVVCGDGLVLVVGFCCRSMVYEESDECV